MDNLTQQRFKSKRLKKQQILKIWERTHNYKMLGYHWELYRLIKDKPNISIKEICNAMPKYYYYKESEHNFTNCPAIYEDVDYIMNSPEVEKIIIKDEGKFRLGTEEECIEYARKLFIRGTRIMAKYGAIAKRISKDGQGKLISAQNKIIDESSDARPFVEAFIENEKADTDLQ